MNDLVSRADAFAANAHEGQQRKYTGDPYIIHPRAVAATVRFYFPDNPEAIAAALLHDVVEDTSATLYDIEDAFGPIVASHVDWLTDKATPDMGNRKARKAFERDRIAKAPAIVQSIKLADLTDNTKSIIEHDKDFAKVYLPEKAAIVGVCTQADPGIKSTAIYTLTRAMVALHEYLNRR